MGLDLRLPIGLIFTLFGVLLTAVGLFSNTDMYERSLGININLWWGIVLLAVGLVFIFLERRSAALKRKASA
jgi:multisubunit Na+/H+ antiporter MnhG subunit